MPSLATRVAYQRQALAAAEAAVSAAAEQVEAATESLSAIEGGTLDLDAVRIGGQRFVNSGGNLVAEP